MGNGPKWPRIVRIASLVVILICAILLARLLPMDRIVRLLTTTIEGLGIWGPIVFGLVYIVASLMFVPGSALTLASGLLFGLAGGTAVVSVASTTSAALAFLIARYLARGAVEGMAGKSPRFAAIDKAIGEGGWKIIAMLRLSPAMPFSLGNYLFGLTRVKFWPYVLTSWLFMLPGTFMYVYLGYIGSAGITAAGGQSSRPPAQWALLIVGLIATIGVTVYVTRLARRAIAQHMEQPSKDDPMPSTQTAASKKSTKPWTAVLAAALAVALMVTTACAYMNPGSVSRLFGPPMVTLTETYAENPSGPKVDHSSFDSLLKKHVSKDGWVNYKDLAKDAAQLDAYIAALATIPFDKLGRSEKLTVLINGYNAFTLRLILDHQPVKSIMDIPANQRWDAVRWTIGSMKLSLNQIEHEQVRPNFKEPRIHFALVCAAVGCPPLRNEAYTAGKLEAQLASQSQYVHTHDRWIQIGADGRSVGLTSLYKWYGSDFEQVAGSGGSVLKYAASQSPQLKKLIDAGRNPSVRYLDYDWSLNSVENAK